MGKAGRLRKHDPVAVEISFAIEAMNNDVAKKLIAKSNVDVLDGESRTPLIYASLSNNIEMLEWLVNNGANINHQDRSGLCSLHAAAQRNNLDVVEYLLKVGGDPNLCNSSGNGPLWIATLNSVGDETMCDVLIAAGADRNHKNNAGRSPVDLKNLKEANRKKMEALGRSKA